MKYYVNDIYSAIQGEGCQTGVPMVLVRLHGCDVCCPWCDTRETWVFEPKNEVPSLQEALGANPLYTQVEAEQIVRYIKENHPGPKWVLLTGGEPALQPLGDLVSKLHSAGYKVALETSGTQTGHIDAGLDWVCVSPKIDIPGGKAVQAQAVIGADEIKFVVTTQKSLDMFNDFLASYPLKKTAQICLQPVSQNKAATELCLKTVIERGWRLSIQIHKYLGLK